MPYILSANPDGKWIKMFMAHWTQPPQVTTMHRAGIASVLGNRILLDGTTLEGGTFPPGHP